MMVLVFGKVSMGISTIELLSQDCISLFKNYCCTLKKREGTKTVMVDKLLNVMGILAQGLGGKLVQAGEKLQENKKQTPAVEAPPVEEEQQQQA
uniref:Uncharacterized protein n=1 Tax=Acrobeloides nanus TaxID=290746 RepID=A0A914CKG8_9BILA